MPQNFTLNYLDYAVEIANKIDQKLTFPNPRVGCVIVQNNKIIATGKHEKYGTSHAEPNAINSLPSNFDFSQTEIYVTLEPCDFFPTKKTPSCTELLIKIKPKKIIIGSLDPKFVGQNIKKLNHHGINTEFFSHPKCHELNQQWFWWQKNHKPFWHLKIAASLDGKISSKNFPKYISNPKSRQLVHQWRNNIHAILSTTSTILADNPQLDVRNIQPINNTNPDLIILGTQKIPTNAKIFQIKNRNIFFFPTLNDFLVSEKYKNIQTIFTECGAKMATEILDLNLADKFSLFISPQFFGTGKNIFTKEIINFNKNYELQNFKPIGNDLLIEFTKKLKTNN